LVGSVEAQGQFVASIESSDKVYHYPWCSHAQRIKPENQIWFADQETAIESGYRPCLDCTPPPLPEITPITLTAYLAAVSIVLVLAKKKQLFQKTLSYN
jgi:methylphosphotriester-DNA--protein-cysteine methyltransferase